MTLDTLAALRQAAETVRAQIPTGGLTRASVEQLLRAAEAVCATAASLKPTPPSRKGTAGPSLHQRERVEARQRWAEIARENAQGFSDAPAMTE